MTSITTKPDSSQPAAETAVYLFDNWFDPIEDRAARSGSRIHPCHDRGRARHCAVAAALRSPCEAARSAKAEGAVGATGHRHGHRSRSLLGSFGRVEIEVPRARLNTA